MVLSSQGACGQQRFYRIVGFKNQDTETMGNIIKKIITHVDSRSEIYSSNVIEAPETAGALKNEFNGQIEKAKRNNHQIDLFLFINGDKYLSPVINAIKSFLQKSKNTINKIGLVNLSSQEETVEGKGQELQEILEGKYKNRIAILSKPPQDLSEALELYETETELPIHQHSAQ